MKNNKHDFASKWSTEIKRCGYTPLPNLLISNQAKLGIAPGEFVVLSTLLSYKWSNDDPYPAIASLAKYTGMASSTVRRHIRSLEAKGLLRRKFREHQTNEYNFDCLVSRLQQLAGKHPPPVQKCTRPSSPTNSSPYSKIDTKEDSFFKKNKVKRGQNSTKPTHIGDILGKRYERTIETNR